MRALPLTLKTLHPVLSRNTAIQFRLAVRPVHQNLKHIAGIHIPPSDPPLESSDVLEDELDDKPAPSTWDLRFPEIHTVQVKHKGKNPGWEDVRVELTSHRDRQHKRARRVWTTLNEKEKTAGLSWDAFDGKGIRSTFLRDREENQYTWPWLGDESREFNVTEKMCAEGRRMWREVIKKGEGNDEEDEKGWEEMMEEEGFNAEIERQMEKWP